MPGAFLPRIALTSGEPAGIGPDLTVQLARLEVEAQLVAVGDPAVLEAGAARLGIPLRTVEFSPQTPRAAHTPGVLPVVPIAVTATVQPGRLDTRNAAYVLSTLDAGCDGCLAGTFDAMVTAPVHKGIINDAGLPFTGHTEYLAQRCGGQKPVMMLVSGELRVALATTHLPLKEVSAAITAELLEEVLTILERDLRSRFGLVRPRIAVCGLNPHAGEGGHLGTEERAIISPVLDALRARGMRLAGPLPADTAFTPARRAQTDAFLAMYHDQGLPVLKAMGFGDAVNITLGLPILRTSVDHGTALELAGSGRAQAGSLVAATRTAIELAHRAAANR